MTVIDYFSYIILVTTGFLLSSITSAPVDPWCKNITQMYNMAGFKKTDGNWTMFHRVYSREEYEEINETSEVLQQIFRESGALAWVFMLGPAEVYFVYAVDDKVYAHHLEPDSKETPAFSKSSYITEPRLSRNSINALFIDPETHRFYYSAGSQRNWDEFLLFEKTKAEIPYKNCKETMVIDPGTKQITHCAINSCDILFCNYFSMGMQSEPYSAAQIDTHQLGGGSNDALMITDIHCFKTGFEIGFAVKLWFKQWDTSKKVCQRIVPDPTTVTSSTKSSTTIRMTARVDTTTGNPKLETIQVLTSNAITGNNGFVTMNPTHPSSCQRTIPTWYVVLVLWSLIQIGILEQHHNCF